MSFIDALEVTKNDDATTTIVGEIPYSELEKYREQSIKHLGKDISVDGFRPGHIPTEILAEKIGEMNILSDMAERALAATYPHMLQNHQIDAVGYPQVSVTKLAPDNPLGFTITVAVMPEFSLPNYHEIAAAYKKESPAEAISDQKIDDATKNIIRRKVAYDRIQQKAAANATDGGSTDLPTPETVNQKAAEGNDDDIPDEELPELTDELAKELGGFATAADFRDKVREELTEQRNQEIRTKHRAAISDALIAATQMTLPQVMIDAEIEQFTAQMQDDLKRAQLSFEEYLQHIKKTEEELKADWRPAAEKRAKIQLILNAIADAEKINPDQKIVDEQVQALKQRYKDADESRIKTYVISVLRNEAVMKFLEEITESENSDAAEERTTSEKDVSEADSTSSNK